MQDTVIAMAILVVLLALWRLHSPPKPWGSIGSWADADVFGPAGSSLFPRSGPGAGTGNSSAGNAGQPGPLSNSPPLSPTHLPASNSNLAASPGGERPTASLPTILPASDSNPAPAIESPPPSNSTLSTHLLNTNGPVTSIAVLPSELVGTPDGVTFASDVAESSVMERRLGQASARGGDIQISLFWKNFNDLDLHCIDPKGEEIFYSNKVSSRTGGQLDVDQNAHAPFNDSPVENIFWPVGGAPPGLYKVLVVHYANHGGLDPTPFTVRLVVKGQTNFFSSAISFTGMREPKPICVLHYDPANPNSSRRSYFGP
jgi:hypothetical protein